MGETLEGTRIYSIRCPDCRRWGVEPLLTRALPEKRAWMIVQCSSCTRLFEVTR